MTDLNEGDDCAHETERMLFRSLQRLDPSLLLELEGTLTRLILTQYATIQTLQGRNAITSALLAMALRAGNVRIDGDLWPSLEEYAARFTRRFLVRCRFENQLHGGSVIRVRELSAVEKNERAAQLAAENSLETTLMARGLRFGRPVLAVVSGYGIAYLDDDLPHIRAGARASSGAIVVPLRNVLQGDQRPWLIPMSLPPMANLTVAAIEIASQLVDPFDSALLPSVWDAGPG